MARVRLGRFPSTEAQLARLALEQESIEVELLGEQLSALQGAIPSSEALVELWVEPEHLERAQRVLTAAFRVNAKGSADVGCPSCGASNPSNFDVCWSCQGDLALAESVARATAPERPRSRPPIFAAVFACTTLLFAALLWKERQLAKFADSPNVHYRWASENCLVLEIGGRMYSRSCDYDHDGSFEQMETFDIKGRHADTAYDANEDGVFERMDSFDAQGTLVSRSFDLDADWRFDRTDGFDLSERMVVRETDSDGDGRMERTESIDAGSIDAGQ